MHSINWKKELYDSSVNLIVRTVKLVEQHPEYFLSLFDLAMSQDGKYAQRASRMVNQLIEKRPDLFGEYIDKILYNLENISDESIKFSFLKIFTFCRLPDDEEKLGLLTKICFDSLEAKVDRIAVKVYAIDILYRLSQIYPELKQELLLLLEKHSEDAQPAFLNRAGKIMAKLQKEIGYNEF